MSPPARNLLPEHPLRMSSSPIRSEAILSRPVAEVKGWGRKQTWAKGGR